MNTRERLLLAVLVVLVLGLALLFYKGRLTVTYRGETTGFGAGPRAAEEAQLSPAARATIEEQVRQAVEKKEGQRASAKKAVAEEVRKALDKEVQSAVDDALNDAVGGAVNAAVDRKLRRLLRTRGIDSSILRNAHQKALVRLHKHKHANKDALLTDAMRIASDARAWKMKPRQFGGGSDEEGFGTLTFEKISYSATGGRHSNHNGVYHLILHDDGRLSVRAVNEKFGNEVIVTLTGPKPGQMKTEVHNLKPEE